MCHCSKLESNVIFVNYNVSLVKLYCVTWHHFLICLNWASAQCMHGSVKFIDRKCSLSSDLQTIVSLLLTMPFEIISVINNSTPTVALLPGLSALAVGVWRIITKPKSNSRFWTSVIYWATLQRDGESHQNKLKWVIANLLWLFSPRVVSKQRKKCFMLSYTIKVIIMWLWTTTSLLREETWSLRRIRGK